ncbi:hypothetical protein V6N12_035387 [Hibiscus sabdariffa]|uniref:Uncharacterized protein n=1 Tax=Hibiscus sabdariffa TaxID=183260 RepID=A0ABR2EQ12_9ROSI
MEAIQDLSRRLEISERVVQNITTKQNLSQEQVHTRSKDEEEIKNILFVSNDEPILSNQDDHPITNTNEDTPQSKDEDEIPCNEKKNDSDDPNEKELVKYIAEGDSIQGIGEQSLMSLVEEVSNTPKNEMSKPIEQSIVTENPPSLK